jgi:predicted alpha/beta superfamily hydrolase
MTFALPDGWLEYADWRGERGGVVGRLLVHPRVRSEALGRSRHILVLVPPSLAGDIDGARRYPVLYMHDGQNLFDAGTSDFGEWRIDETMAALADEGVEAIVVGVPGPAAAVPPDGDARAFEYGPHEHDGWGGGGDRYLGFLVDVVKPLVDGAFPTLRESVATGIAGSSLGGLISVYALVARPEIFGFAGVVSPAFLFDDGRTLREDAPRLRPGPEGPRIYVDVGGREGSHEATPAEQDRVSRRYLDDARALRDLLRASGFVDGEDLLYVEDLEAIHHQDAWALRMPAMLRFLLRQWASAPGSRTSA